MNKNLAKSSVLLVKVAMNDATLEHVLLVGVVVAKQLSSKQHLKSHYFTVILAKVRLQVCFSATGTEKYFFRQGVMHSPLSVW